MSASDERPTGSAHTTVRLDTEAAVKWCLMLLNYDNNI